MIAQVVGGVHRADPALRGVPIHITIRIDASYAKGVAGGQIGVGQPSDVAVGVVDDLAAEGRDQRGVGLGSGEQAGAEDDCGEQGLRGFHYDDSKFRLVFLASVFARFRYCKHGLELLAEYYAIIIPVSPD